MDVISKKQQYFAGWLILILFSTTSANLNLQYPCLTTMMIDLKTSKFMMQFSLVLGPILAIFANIYIAYFGNTHERRRLAIICTSLFSVGTFICGISEDMIYYLCGRAVQILGEAGISILGFAILSDIFEENSLGQFLGYNTILVSITSISSPLLSAWILVHYSWRLNFYLLSFISSVLFVLFYFYLPQPNIQSKNNLPIQSFKSFIHELKNIFKLPLFLFVVITPALYSSVASLFDYNSPFIYIDKCNLSPEYFSYIKTFLVFSNVLGSIAYIYILKYKNISVAFKIGFVTYLIYTTGLLISFLLKENTFFYFFLLPTMIFNISYAFINPLFILKIISYPHVRKEMGLTAFALARNIITSIILFSASCFFAHNVYHIFILMLIISIIIIILLTKIQKEF